MSTTKIELSAHESLPAQSRGARPMQFDRVLVDAPCSGTGVLGKRSDLRWQRKPSDIAELVRLQVWSRGHVIPPRLLLMLLMPFVCHIVDERLGRSIA